jgi:hypothetical protein
LAYHLIEGRNGRRQNGRADPFRRPWCRHRHDGQGAKASGTGADASPGADDATGEPPRRDSRFGLRLKLSSVHWVRPEVVVDVTYFTWTEDNLPVAGLALRGAAKGQAGNAGSADNSASASTQRGPSMNGSETGIGRCQRRWFGLTFPLPVVPTATQAAGENDDVAVGFALALCLYLAFMFTSSRHLSPGTDDTPRCGMIGRSLSCWAGLALVGCWH